MSPTDPRPTPSAEWPAVEPPHARTSDPGPQQPADLLDSVWRGPQAIYVLDGSWIVEAWNPSAEDLWGIPAGMAIGRLIDDLVDWQPVSGPGRDLGRVAREERGWFERRLDRPRVGTRLGELIVVDTSVAAERGPAADIRRIVVTARDVTRSVYLATEMASSAALGTGAGGIRGRHEVAREALEILARTTGAHEGIVALFHETSYETLAEINEGRLAGVLSIVEPGSSAILNSLKPGLVIAADPLTLTSREDVHAQIEAFALRWVVATPIWTDDSVVGIVAIAWVRTRPKEPAELAVLDAATHLSAALENARLVEDLSARYESAQLLTEASAQRYRTLFTDAPEAYVVTTVGGVITDMNPNAEELYQTGPHGLVGRHVDDIFDIAPAEYARWNAAMEQDGRTTFRGVGRRVDGSAFAQQLDVRRVMLDGEPRDLVQVRDTTEPDRLQAELLQAQKMDAVGQLVAGVAHELNNPLQAIIGFSKLLGNDPNLPEDLRSDASLLVTEATRTKRIVENLLNFARHRPPERHPTRLGLLVESILELQSYQLSGGIAVEVDIPDDLPPVPLDRAMMQQVILNLTQNAIQAIQADSGHGTLHIGAWLAENEAGAPVARLAFADDGPGVPEANRDRVFLPFFTTKDPGEGTGLGLSVSFGIVAGHGGRLWFEPAPGGGSIFTLELPLVLTIAKGASVVVPGPADSGPGDSVATADDVGIAGPQAAPATAARRLRILVLDDEETIRTFLVRVLRDSVDVVATGTGADALRLIEAGDFDGIICDHRMPGMTGTDVYRRVATIRPALARHFVLMSGDVLNPEVSAFAEGRAIRLLSKPFEIETLQAIIAEISADVVASGRQAS